LTQNNSTTEYDPGEAPPQKKIFTNYYFQEQWTLCSSVSYGLKWWVWTFWALINCKHVDFPTAEVCGVPSLQIC